MDATTRPDKPSRKWSDSATIAGCDSAEIAENCPKGKKAFKIATTNNRTDENETHLSDENNEKASVPRKKHGSDGKPATTHLGNTGPHHDSEKPTEAAE